MSVPNMNNYWKPKAICQKPGHDFPSTSLWTVSNVQSTAALYTLEILQRWDQYFTEHNIHPLISPH